MGRLLTTRKGRQSIMNNDYGDRRDKSRKAVKRSSTGEPKGQPSPAKTSPKRKRQLSQRAAKLPKTSPTTTKKPQATSPVKTPTRVTNRQLKKSVTVTQGKKKLNHDKKPVRVTKPKGKATTSTAKGKRQIRDSKGTSKKKVLGVKGAKKKVTTVVKTKVATAAKGSMKKRATVAKPKGTTIAKGGKKKGKTVAKTKKLTVAKGAKKKGQTVVKSTKVSVAKGAKKKGQTVVKPKKVTVAKRAKKKGQTVVNSKKVSVAKGAKKKGQTVVKSKKVTVAKGANKKGQTVVKPKKESVAKGAKKKGQTVVKSKGVAVDKGTKKKGTKQKETTDVETKKASGVKETEGKKKRVPKHPNSKLTPNLEIQVVEKDPMFEVKTETEIPKVSDYVDCKRAIRAVLTKDSALLKKLINNTKEIPSLFVPRSVCLQDDALDYAVKTENLHAMKLLYKEYVSDDRCRKSMSQALMQQQGTGSYNYRSLGHAVQEINIGRKCREGNNAFTKDINFYQNPYSNEHERLGKFLTIGLSPQMLNQLVFLFGTDRHRMADFAGNIYQAVRAGHHRLAGELIKKTNVGGGYGFNKLHEEVLLVSTPQELTPFRSVSVLKKPLGNDKITPLHCAAINPNPKILEKLLSILPNYSEPDDVGFLPIHYAAACEGSGPLELLLKKGAKADEFQTKTMVTPLMIAAKYGRAQNIETLIKNIKSGTASSEENPEKMAVGHKTKKGHFAIHYAAEGGHVDCVQSLVQHGAAVEAMESALNNKITPLMIASERGYFRLAKVLIEELGAVIEKRDKIKRTSLMLACMNGHYPVATLLLRKGADPNAQDSSGNTPVHYAAAYGWWHCLKLLLKAGGDPNILTDWKVPPLGLAYLKGHFGCVDLLLKEPGVDVNFKDENGATLLLITCAQSMSETTTEQLEYLIKAGADVQAVDINGRNALHFIAILNQRSNHWSSPDPLRLTLEVVALLIDKGCDPAHIDKEGKTPLSIALQNGHFEYVWEFLVKAAVVPLDADLSGDNPLHYIAKNYSQSRASIIQLLASVAKAVKLDEACKMKDRQGCTPFLRCIVDNRGCTSSEDVTAILAALAEISDIDARVDRGSDTAPNDFAGCCALHFLAIEAPTDIWSKIIGMKPTLDVLNADGKTPLIMAIDAKQTQKVHTLLSEGADPNASDEFQHFALLRAVCNDLPDIIPDLIAKGANIHGSLFKNKQPGIMHYIPAYIKNLDAKLRTAKALVAAGASLSTVDDENRTVLHSAVNAIESHVTTEFLEFLLDHKLDVFAVDNFGRLPVHYAIYKYNPFGENSPLRGGQFNNESHLDPIETLSLLDSAMDGKKLNVQDKYGRTPMHYAAFRGAMISAMHIAEMVDDIDVLDQDGHTPLSWAILNRQESVVIWLIQRGANINREVKLVGLESRAEDKRLEPTKSTDEPQYWKWKTLETPDAPDPRAQTSIFQAVVYEEWQGAVYVMMDRIAKCAISYADAIGAVLAQQKFQLANELIRKMRNPLTLQTTNDKGQNLLHLLAIYSVEESHRQRQIATTLLHNGVKLFVTDYKGCTPLHYAAVNMNVVVCRVFAEKDPIGFKSCITCADHRGRVPVASLFWSLSYNSTKDIIELIRQHNGSLDVCTAFPNVSLLIRKRLTRSESLQDWYQNLPDEKTIDVTPLILMILMNNFAGCQLLVKNGADPNATDRNGVTPLMHAVLQNEIAVVSVLVDKNYAEPLTSRFVQQVSPWITNIWKLKKSGSYSREATYAVDDGYEADSSPNLSQFPKCEKTSSINLNAVDSQGRTAVHYLMKTCDYGTYENVEMLELLARVGAKLSERDHQGKTPLDYSMETGSQKMAAALQKLTGVDPRKQVVPKLVNSEWSDGIDFHFPKPDVDNDAKAMVEVLEEERSKTRQADDMKPFVDTHSDMADSGVVLMDEEQGIGYDLIMTKVEVQYGTEGLNNFYKMQLIHQLGKDMIVLFTRWGRIGDTGKFQKTPFGTKEEAIVEFKKIFKAKSGNDWANVKNFQKKPKKYMLVEIDPWRAKRNEAIKEFQFDLESPVPSKLSQDVQHLLHKMTKPQALRMALGETGVDASIMNFSHLSRDVLQKAIDILDKLGEAIKESEKIGEDGFQASLEKLCELSNEYFYIIPHENFAHDVMEPIWFTEEVEDHKKKLSSLLELEMANRILLGATYRKQEINPLDYIYRFLDCKIKLMDKDDEETQHVLQYIHQSSDGNPPKVKAIYRLSRDGEEELLKACNLDNHKLLWHGSSVLNLLSILKKGLQINPAEAQRSGASFGEGVYTSDAFAKSVTYCRQWEQQQPSHFILLCEVALGDSRNSRYVEGRIKTNGKRELYLPSGVSLPLGTLYTEERHWRFESDYNEYVAYTEEQVCLRYLVQVV